jgi:hypothetical protein
VGEYAKSGVGVNREEQVFSIDADFWLNCIQARRD